MYYEILLRLDKLGGTFPQSAPFFLPVFNAAWLFVDFLRRQLLFCYTQSMSILESKTIFTGRIITLNQEKVCLPDNSIDDLEIIHHPGGTAIIAVNEKMEVCLLRQYRHAMQEWVWELPAGVLEKNDHQLLDRAKKELQEEAGCTAINWHKLGFVQSSPGVFTEKVYLFLASGLSHGDQQLEHGEVLEVHWLPFTDAITQVHEGIINDAKTCIALFRAAKHLNISLV